MNTIEFTLALALASLVAGFLGALTGLGGGVVIVPFIVLAFGADIHYAIGASLVSVIATSSGAAASYVHEGYSNIRADMFLEIATTLGALSGASIATRVPTNGLAIVFGVMLLHSEYLSSHRHDRADDDLPPDRWATALRLDSAFPTPSGQQHYRVQHVPAGFGLMYGAGMLSGLLGIGSGAVKVLVMDHAMRLPFKVSTTTSNFMIGVTAAASAGIYLHRGYMDSGLAMPVVLDVLLGSMCGARVLITSKSGRLRLVFTWVILALGAEMLFNGLSGHL